jgi:L-threonylcarbamoyladenylate synthase
VTEQRRVVLGELGPGDVSRLGDLMTQARLICFPTDTLYGVGGRLRPSVAELVYATKRRGRDKPLQVVFPSLETLLATVSIGERTREAVRRLLPGGVTLLLPYPRGLHFPPPGRIGGGGVRQGSEVETLGVRVPRWPEAARVLGALGFPLLASSANASGAPPAASLDEVDPVIRSACDLLLDAGAVAGRPSTVLDLTFYEHDGTWRVLRAGALSGDEVHELLERRRHDWSK